MIKLKVIENTELSEYAIKLLRKQDINTPQDIFDQDNAKLVKILNITEKAVLDIRKALRTQYGPRKYQLTNNFGNLRDVEGIYYTGIQNLDKLLFDDDVYFEKGAVWEVCGLPGVGKTQFCKTIALNFATKFGVELLFVDTKCDFSGSRIRQMLRNRNVDIAQCGHIMNLIKVERTMSVDGVLRIMEELLQQLQNNVPAAKAIKMVIIDSLPAVWLLLNNDEEHLSCRHSLARLSMLVYKLSAEHALSFLLVNVSLRYEHSRSNEIKHSGAEQLSDDEIDDDHDVIPQNIEFYKPALGRCWSNVPKIRLSIELAPTISDNSGLRILKILKSCYSQSEAYVQIQLTDAGFV